MKLSPNNNCVQRKMENVLYGVYQHPHIKRSRSDISIDEPSHLELVRCRKLLIKDHPLLPHKPSEWKNIPACVSSAISDILKHIVGSDEVLFEFQAKTNERFYRVQDQISNLKDRLKHQNMKFISEMDNRFKTTDDNIMVKFSEFDNNMKGNLDQFE